MTRDEFIMELTKNFGSEEEIIFSTSDGDGGWNQTKSFEIGIETVTSIDGIARKNDNGQYVKIMDKDAAFNKLRTSGGLKLLDNEKLMIASESRKVISIIYK